MSESRVFLNLSLVAVLLTCLGCAKVSATGRVQLNLVSRSEELALGKQAALQMYRSTRTCRDPAQAAAVRRVGKAIAAKADVPDANWSFNCIEEGGFNALCLPGGIVFVNSGVFRHVENDDQLAGVIGHEVGHALARHGAEKLSRGRLTVATVAVVAVGVGVAAQSADAMDATANLLNATALYAFMLPGSREQEYEADKLGLQLMAKAGYDPAQFPLLWSRLIERGVMKNTSDFAQTHPADAKRLEAMRAYLPEARRLAGLPPEGQPAVAQAQPTAEGQNPPQARDEQQGQGSEQTAAQTVASALTESDQSLKVSDQSTRPESAKPTEQTPSDSPNKGDQATTPAAGATQDQAVSASAETDEDLAPAPAKPLRSTSAKKKTSATNRQAPNNAFLGEETRFITGSD